MSFTLSNLYRRFKNLIRIGTIAEVDEQHLRLCVQSGELLSGWLPWPAQVGNNFIHWRQLSVVKPLPHRFNDLTCDKVFIGGHQPGILYYRRSRNNPVSRIFINRLIKLNR